MLEEKIEYLSRKYKNLPLDSKKWVGLGFSSALVLALPLTMWSFLNNNFDIRERAATGELTPTPAISCSTLGGICELTTACSQLGGINFGQADCGSNYSCCKFVPPTTCADAGGSCVKNSLCSNRKGNVNLGQYDCSSGQTCCGKPSPTPTTYRVTPTPPAITMQGIDGTWCYDGDADNPHHFGYQSYCQDSEKYVSDFCSGSVVNDSYCAGRQTGKGLTKVHCEPSTSNCQSSGLACGSGHCFPTVTPTY